MLTKEIYISVLDDTVEVDEQGRFELPSRSYSCAELKKIAREVNRAIRQSTLNPEDD